MSFSRTDRGPWSEEEAPHRRRRPQALPDRHHEILLHVEGKPALFIRYTQYFLLGTPTVKFFISMSHIHTDRLTDKRTYFISQNFDIVPYSLSLINHNACICVLSWAKRWDQGCVNQRKSRNLLFLGNPHAGFCAREQAPRAGGGGRQEGGTDGDAAGQRSVDQDWAWGGVRVIVYEVAPRCR